MVLDGLVALGKIEMLLPRKGSQKILKSSQKTIKSSEKSSEKTFLSKEKNQKSKEKTNQQNNFNVNKYSCLKNINNWIKLLIC